MASEIKRVDYNEIHRKYPTIDESLLEKAERYDGVHTSISKSEWLTDKKGVQVLDRDGNKISTKPDISKIIKEIEMKTPLKSCIPRDNCTNGNIDSHFEGWWQLETTFGQNGMAAQNVINYSSTQQRNDSYINISISGSIATIFSSYYNDVYPQYAPDFFNPALSDLGPQPPVLNIFQYTTNGNNSKELISPYNPPVNALVNQLQSYTVGPTLKLIDSCTLHVYEFLNYKYGFSSGTPIVPCIYKKIKNPPNDTSFLNWNNPLNIFLFYVADMKYHNFCVNPHTKANAFVGFKKEKKILHKMQNEGLTVTVPLRKIRITNTTNYSDIDITTDTWTNVYTGCPVKNKGIFVPITPGCSPTISGATGSLSILNGTYPNGVGVFNNGGDKTLNPRFVDIGKNGSMNDYFNCFLLNLDTSSLLPLADINGWINLPEGINVTTTYKITASSEYPEMMAAIRAYYYLVIRTTTHGGIRGYTPLNSARYFNTFNDLRIALANATVSQNPRDNGPITGYPQYNQYYHNWVDFGSKDGNYMNYPWPLTYNNTILEYDVAIGNYLTNVQVLYFAIQGTLESDQADPSTTFGYLPVIPAPGRATCVGKLLKADVTTVPGLIIPNGPNGDPVPVGYQTMGSYGNDFQNLNAYYIGTVNPILTNGKTIGYFRLSNCLFCDSFAVMIGGLYAPENPNTSKNPRIWREALCAVYAPIFQWFNSIGCDKIIIDWVNNKGGTVEIPLTISEFCGSDRLIFNQYVIPKNPKKPLISSDEKNFKVIDNAWKKTIKSCYAYTNLSEKLYPGSVFKGDCKSSKYIAFLTDYASISGGDIGPNFFTGKNDNGDLGNNTYCRIIGNIDGREFAYSSGVITPPYNKNPLYNSTNFIDINNDPAVPFKYIRDDSTFIYGYTEKQITMARQHNGIIPLPNPIKGTSKKYNNSMPYSAETTNLPDFGINPPIRFPIPGWTSLHSYPPNFTDQTTWQFTGLDGAILTLLNPEKYFFSKKFKKLKKDDSKLSLK
jgi:hypothetical protein